MSTILTRGSSSGLGLGLGVGVGVGVGVAPPLTFLVQILGFSGFRSRLSEGGEEEGEGEGWVWVKGMEHMAMPSSPSPA